MDDSILSLVFSVLGAVISALKRITFLSVPLFYWALAFLILSAVISSVLNVVSSPFVESEREATSARLSRERSWQSKARSDLESVYSRGEFQRRNLDQRRADFDRARISRKTRK